MNGTLVKVGVGGEKWRAATGYAMCIFCLSSRIGFFPRNKFLGYFNWFVLFLSVTKFADWQTVSSFLLGSVNFMGLSETAVASSRDVSGKFGQATAENIGMGVLVGLMKCD